MAEIRKEIPIVTPPETRPDFSNATKVTVSDNSVIIQFGFVRPSAESGQLVAEVVLTSKHAIDFGRALNTALKKHFTRHLEEPAILP